MRWFKRLFAETVELPIEEVAAAEMAKDKLADAVKENRSLTAQSHRIARASKRQENEVRKALEELAQRIADHSGDRE